MSDPAYDRAVAATAHDAEGVVHHCFADPEATVADGWCRHPGYRHRYGTLPAVDDWPPTPPAGEDVERVARDGLRDLVKSAVTEAIEEAYTFEGDLDPTVDEIVTDAVLAALSARPQSEDVERAWDERGGTLWLDREEWGVVTDALITLRSDATRRKAANPESTSDIRAEMAERIILRLNAAAALSARPVEAGEVDPAMLDTWRRASEAARKAEHHFPADNLAEAVEVVQHLARDLAAALARATAAEERIEKVRALADEYPVRWPKNSHELGWEGLHDEVTALLDAKGGEG